MVVVIDRRRTDRAGSVVDLLRSYLIPTVFVHYGKSKMPDKALAYVVFSDMVDEMNGFSVDDKEKIVTAIGEHIRDEKKREAEKLRVVERILDLLWVKYSINPEAITRGKFSITEGVPRYCGHVMRLTSIETFIVMCLSFSNGEWVSSGLLSDYCLNGKENTGSIPVHVCNINSKSKDCSLIKLIEFKRFSGYRIKNQLL